MKIKFHLFLLQLFILFSVKLLSQPIDNEYKKNIKEFFSMINDEKFDDAVDYMYSSNPWIKSKTDELAKVKSSINGLKNLVGKYIGNDFLTEETLSSRLVRTEYIVYFQRQPFRFYFVFYKPEDEWMTYEFGYHDSVGDWLEEKTKTKYLYGEY
jgi:hypothetical protein